MRSLVVLLKVVLISSLHDVQLLLLWVALFPAVIYPSTRKDFPLLNSSSTSMRLRCGCVAFCLWIVESYFHSTIGKNVPARDQRLLHIS
jgi:hypothetical protein